MANVATPKNKAVTRRFFKVTAFAAIAVFLGQAGTLVEALLSARLIQAASGLTVALTAGVAGAIQKGYVWNDVPEGETE